MLRLKLVFGAIVENDSDGLEASFRVAIEGFGEGCIRR